jgi:hypothetical protein
MGVHILHDSDSERACLLDSVTETPFGRAFIGRDASEMLEAFVAWYAKEGAHRDPRVDPNIRDVQDAWLAKLDNGCGICGAEPWEACEGEGFHEGGQIGEHARVFTPCARRDDLHCRRHARFTNGGKAYCGSHAPNGSLLAMHPGLAASIASVTGVCPECEAMPTGADGRAAFCARHEVVR